MVQTKNLPQPLVTVCVPTYNHGKFIAEALESIFSQSIENLIVIVADDCSQDDTLDVINRYKKSYGPKMIVLENRENLGVIQNVEKIYHHIPENTKYLSWFAGDDIMLPGKLSQQIKFLENNPDHIMCYHDACVRDDIRGTQYRYNHILFGQKAYSGHISGKLIEKGCFIAVHSVLVNYQKSAKIKHNPELSVCNDWSYVIELSIAGKVGYLGQVLTVYRRHSNNITRTVFDDQGPINVLRYIRKKYPGLNKEVSVGLMRHHVAFAWRHLLKMNFPKSKIQFKNSFRYAFSGYRFMFYFLSTNISFFIKRVMLFLKIGSIFR